MIKVDCNTLRCCFGGVKVVLIKFPPYPLNFSTEAGFKIKLQLLF